MRLAHTSCPCRLNRGLNGRPRAWASPPGLLVVDFLKAEEAFTTKHLVYLVKYTVCASYEFALHVVLPPTLSACMKQDDGALMMDGVAGPAAWTEAMQRTQVRGTIRRQKGGTLCGILAFLAARSRERPGE